jgi:hypothetical protein
MDIAAIWRQAADKWNEVAAQVDDDQRGDPCATCPGWSIGDLIDHAMHWQAQGAAGLTDVAPDASWDDVQAALSVALSDPANLEGTVDALGGMSKQQVAGFLIGDLVIHSWDLARSVGADDSETMFGPPVEVGHDASPQEQLLGFVGRTP